ncbi:hypothetical protein LSTR_LSTR004451 [Laodelphax striatellus]|uniref:Uncharacterized protein n=1 Tax=Laodelphax striatellus TaxID=195883 RepID=A0A482XA41_LAOST|nr:hypothetical protein LSTR_LSTR004451 [Laodelphax striatellus]
MHPELRTTRGAKHLSAWTNPNHFKRGFFAVAKRVNLLSDGNRERLSAMRRGMRLRRFRRRIDFSGGESRGARVRSDRMGVWAWPNTRAATSQRSVATRHDRGKFLAGWKTASGSPPPTPKTYPFLCIIFLRPQQQIDRLDPNSKIRLHISFNLIDELVQSTFEISSDFT